MSNFISCSKINCIKISLPKHKNCYVPKGHTTLSKSTIVYLISFQSRYTILRIQLLGPMKPIEIFGRGFSQVNKNIIITPKMKNK